MWSLAVFLSLCSLILVDGAQCDKSGGCPSSTPCCSQWGWCGTGTEYCGAGCQSGCGGGGGGGTQSGGAKKGDWEFCSLSSECAKGCCSKEWSNDGRLKCTPGGSQCTGGGGSPTGGGGSPAPVPVGGGGAPGTIGAIITESEFNRALSACGISGHTDLYRTFVNGGFTAPLRDKGELALLMGNIAHESGAFRYTEEIACTGVNWVTDRCPYGRYHGRGYIQISWDYNYRAAADYLGNQQILNNPDIVRDDLKVNLQTVQWYWTTRVQPTLKSSGYTLAASVRAINGGLECGGNPISGQRIRYVQCFQQQYGVPVDRTTWCATESTTVNEGDDNTDAPSNNDNGDNNVDIEVGSEDAGVPGYAVGLLVLGCLIVVVLASLIVVVLTQKPSAEHF